MNPVLRGPLLARALREPLPAGLGPVQAAWPPTGITCSKSALQPAGPSSQLGPPASWAPWPDTPFLLQASDRLLPKPVSLPRSLPSPSPMPPGGPRDTCYPQIIPPIPESHPHLPGGSGSPATLGPVAVLAQLESGTRVGPEHRPVIRLSRERGPAGRGLGRHRAPSRPGCPGPEGPLTGGIGFPVTGGRGDGACQHFCPSLRAGEGPSGLGGAAGSCQLRPATQGGGSQGHESHCLSQQDWPWGRPVSSGLAQRGGLEDPSLPGHGRGSANTEHGLHTQHPGTRGLTCAPLGAHRLCSLGQGARPPGPVTTSAKWEQCC